MGLDSGHPYRYVNISHSQVFFAHSHFHGIRGCTLHSSISGLVLSLETCLASDLPLVNMNHIDIPTDPIPVPADTTMNIVLL